MAEVWKSDQKIIGEKIKKARKAAKLTQEQFAEEMGGSCSNKVISRYEKGEVEMGVQTLIDIAENLEVPVDSLMPERVQVHTEPEDDEMSRLFSGLNAENKKQPQSWKSDSAMKKNSWKSWNMRHSSRQNRFDTRKPTGRSWSRPMKFERGLCNGWILSREEHRHFLMKRLERM